MKNTIILLISCISLHVNAQINKVVIQASGLTCSMCSNAINKALKSIDYVDHVVPDIKNSSFEISFKSNAAVSYDQLKKKVEGAGFFVAKLEATIMFDHVNVSNDAHIEVDGIMYHFLHVNGNTLNGENVLRIVDKGFVSAKEYKKNEKYTKMECYHSGIIGNCCNNKSKSMGTRIYHVII